MLSLSSFLSLVPTIREKRQTQAPPDLHSLRGKTSGPSFNVSPHRATEVVLALGYNVLTGRPTEAFSAWLNLVNARADPVCRDKLVDLPDWFGDPEGSHGLEGDA